MQSQIMRSLFVVALLALGQLSPAVAQNKRAGGQNVPKEVLLESQGLAIGDLLPFRNVPLMDAVSHRPVTIDSVMGKQGLLVMFSCNTCPFVVKSQERTKEAMTFAKRRGIGMIIINSNEAQRQGDDSFDEMMRYGQMQGYEVPYVIDQNNIAANIFGATRTPEVYLFNAVGKLVYKGAMEDNPASPKESKNLFLQTAMENLISNKPISPQSTKSIGCSIKRMDGIKETMAR